MRCCSESGGIGIKKLESFWALIFDWLYFPINFILWLLRWVCWLLKIMLAIIGWNTLQDANGNYYSVLAQILAWITQNLMIPYV